MSMSFVSVYFEKLPSLANSYWYNSDSSISEFLDKRLNKLYCSGIAGYLLSMVVEIGTVRSVHCAVVSVSNNVPLSRELFEPCFANMQMRLTIWVKRERDWGRGAGLVK